jgi:hypothetical protein
MIICFLFWFTETSRDYRFTGIREVHRVTDCKGLPEEKDCILQYRSMLSCKRMRNCEFRWLFLFVVTYFWALEKKAILWHISFWKIIAVIVASQKQVSTFARNDCYCRLIICNVMAMWNYILYLCVGTTPFTSDIWMFRFQFMVPVYFLMIWSKPFMYKVVQTVYWVIRTKDDSLRGQNSGFLQSAQFMYLYSTSFCRVFVHFSSCYMESIFTDTCVHKV